MKATNTWHTDPVSRELVLSIEVNVEGALFRASEMVSGPYAFPPAPPARYVEVNLRRMVMRDLEQRLFGDVL